MSHVIVVGGGAAGMFAAIFAARNGHQVTIYEKNEKLGKKLFITGKGRCNLTNASDIENLFEQVVSNKKFLYSAFYAFDNIRTMDFFKELGLKIKIERGERVFPISDKSSDVIHTLEKELHANHVKIEYHTTVEKVLCKEGRFCGVVIAKKNESPKTVYGDGVIITTGGLSYPITGSTGDGYRFAKEMGHTVNKLSPGLVPLQIRENCVKALQGLSLKNVSIKVYAAKKEVYHDFGEMLFTHFGVSGPLILSSSSYIQSYIGQKELQLVIDLKPALSEEQLNDRILRDFQEMQNKQFKNSLDRLLPKKMIPVIMELSRIDPQKKINLVTKEERYHLVQLLKNFTLHIERLRGYNEAIITQGGISVKEVNPSTMESQKVKNVHFAGEVLDVDALTGGYNLQIAWSTAYLAGTSICT